MLMDFLISGVYIQKLKRYLGYIENVYIYMSANYISIRYHHLNIMRMFLDNKI